MIKTINDVVRSGLCISCGACARNDSNEIEMVESSLTGMYEPKMKGLKITDDLAFEVCPGKGYDIKKIASAKFPVGNKVNDEIGSYIQIGAGYSLDPNIAENASSGGLMTAIAHHLLEDGIVDGVVVTEMISGDKKNLGPRPNTYIAKDLSSLILAQGSKYCPVPALDIQDEAESFDGKLAFIGTPCQIAGIELLKGKGVDWTKKVVFTIANFCGGFRDLRETDTIIRRAGFNPSDVDEFKYRGNGQPGRMLIASDSLRKEVAYPDYVRSTGYIKHKRCRYCIDATGELADISLGDAWIDKFLSTGRPWSLFVARSKSAVNLLSSMESKVEYGDISLDELILSQLGNISSKKYRNSSRNTLAKILQINVPSFDVEIKNDKNNIFLELKILVSHYIFYMIEKVGMYKIFAKLIGRYPKDI